MESSTDLALLPPGPEVLGRAGHSAVVHGQHMWVYGGYQLGDGQVVTSGSPDAVALWSPDDLIRFAVTALCLRVCNKEEGYGYFSILGTILLPKAGRFLRWQVMQSDRVLDMDTLQ